MNIVLTNDDGINSIGLKKLEIVLKKYGNVFVVAPSTQQSAKGCATTAFLGLKATKIDNSHIAVDGTPVDCVEVACALLNKKIDLIVSGCNNGHNLGIDIMYSGTCGACFQASLAKVPSIAFSCKNSDYFDLIEVLAPQVLDYIFNNNLLNESYYFNVNFPTTKQISGIKLTKIFAPVYEEYFPVSFTSFDDTIIIDRKRLTSSKDSIFDEVAVENGYISVTPLSQNLYKEELFNQISNKIDKK